MLVSRLVNKYAGIHTYALTNFWSMNQDMGALPPAPNENLVNVVDLICSSPVWHIHGGEYWPMPQFV